MSRQLHLEILPQPDDSTCGPTCLHAVYRYFGEDFPLSEVIGASGKLDEGGTLAVLLGSDARRRGYQAKIFTFNLKVFDPTWFATHPRQPGSAEPLSATSLVAKLQAQVAAKASKKLTTACQAYIDFLQLGGKLEMRDLTASLIRRYLKRSIPILTGLSSTYLYRAPRECGPPWVDDDVRGVPQGHFVVLCGYDGRSRMVQVADPYLSNPLGEEHYYEVGLDRLVCAILLGVLTYDANLLVIEPGKVRAG